MDCVDVVAVALPFIVGLWWFCVSAIMLIVAHGVDGNGRIWRLCMCS
jgi:hypothetical protein